MDKDLIGLIATWTFIILGLVALAFSKSESKLFNTGFLFVIFGSCSYLSIFFFDIPIYARYSTLEGNSGKTKLLLFTGVGILFLLLSRVFGKTNKN